MNKKQLKIKLNKIFSKNPNFVFYDYDNECVGDDLLKLISYLLKAEYEKGVRDGSLYELKQLGIRIKSLIQK